MTTTDNESYITVGNSCCEKCKHYIKGFDQIASVFCTTCTRIMIVKRDWFEEKEE